MAINPDKQFYEDVYGDYDGYDDDDYLYDWDDEYDGYDDDDYLYDWDDEYDGYDAEPTRLDLLREWFFNLKWRIKNMIHLCRKCPDCGKRFGRHDWNACIPF